VSVLQKSEVKHEHPDKGSRESAPRGGEEVVFEFALGDYCCCSAEDFRRETGYGS
jgi:hypothetical protein